MTSAPAMLGQVDAFAGRVFAGNPAAVVPLEQWLDDATLQAIAAENNFEIAGHAVKFLEGVLKLP
jgi:predicted PhzF superfamily epimerase YddE/YHI9